jgi:threonine aldolase
MRQVNAVDAARPIDLRSDTVTRPDQAMRAAMAAAEVGDDVLEHDPTMAALEDELAGVLGVPAALWVPSGSMGNLIALMLSVRRGDSFLASQGAHVLSAELGTAAWLAGGMPVPLAWDADLPGVPSPASVTTAARAPGAYYDLRPALLCLENTHNAAGGAVLPPARQAELVTAARAAGLRVHLDGARLWNAAIALRLPVSALTAGADTVQVCFSKGLGAPVGSAVAGSVEFVADARRVRKMLGGGVRQGGVLAAACLVALRRRDELAADHAAAVTLADGLTELGWQVSAPLTNMVYATVPDPAAAAAVLASVGVLAVPLGGRLRFVTHRDAGLEHVAEALRRLRAARGQTAVAAHGSA